MYCTQLLLVLLVSIVALEGSELLLVRLGKIWSEEELKKIPLLFFFQKILNYFFEEKKWEALLASLQLSRQLLSIIYGATFFYLINSNKISLPLPLISAPLAAVLLYLLTNQLTQLLILLPASRSLPILAPLTSIWLTLFVPFVRLNIEITKRLRKKINSGSSLSIQNKMLDLLYESEFLSYFNPQERKQILSIAHFKERSVGEVMIPRSNMISISKKASFQKLIELFLKERYSRLPVYGSNSDQIIGVILYKELLSALIEGNPKNRSIESLIRPVIYVLEKRKIASLLQEFLHKQIHLAIVVDEYGTTQGIVTIEDLLEELVGEIADEDDDLQLEKLYSSLSPSGWIVDGRMGIVDIQRQLSIPIPQNSAYNTLGGYISHLAGRIPPKGWKFHHDHFDLEIVEANSKAIKKAEITLHQME